MFDLKKLFALAVISATMSSAHATMTMPGGMLSKGWDLPKVDTEYKPVGDTHPQVINTEKGQWQASYEWPEKPVYQLVC